MTFFHSAVTWFCWIILAHFGVAMHAALGTNFPQILTKAEKGVVFEEATLRRMVCVCAVQLTH